MRRDLPQGSTPTSPFSISGGADLRNAKTRLTANGFAAIVAIEAIVEVEKIPSITQQIGVAAENGSDTNQNTSHRSNS